MAAEAQRIGHCRADSALVALVRNVIQVALGVRLVEVARGREELVLDGFDRDDGLDPARRAQKMAVMDFVEETFSFAACSPKTALMALVSMGSLIGVEVPWALT